MLASLASGDSALIGIDPVYNGGFCHLDCQRLIKLPCFSLCSSVSSVIKPAVFLGVFVVTFILHEKKDPAGVEQWQR